MDDCGEYEDNVKKEKNDHEALSPQVKDVDDNDGVHDDDMVDDNDVVDDDDAGDDDDAAEDDVTLDGIDNGVVDGDDDVGEQVVERSDRAVRPIGQSGECPQYTPSNRGHRQYSSFCISPLQFVFSLLDLLLF